MICEFVYFYHIIDDDINNCFELIEKELSLLVKSENIGRMYIILSCESSELLEKLSYSINIIIRGGNGIGYKINNKLYHLKLISSNKTEGYDEFVKIIKENNNREILFYFYYTPNLQTDINNSNRIDINLSLLKKYLNKLTELEQKRELGLYTFFVNNKFNFPFILLLNNINDIDNRENINIINDIDNNYMFYM